MNNNTKNTLIILPVIAIVAYAMYLLYSEQHSTSTTIQETASRQAIGEMLSIENNVKREFDQDVVWNNIQKSEPVYNRDSVRTGKDSGAVIRLNDGTILELGENSLILLDQSTDTFNVNFKAGDLAAKNSGKNLQIAVKDSMIKGEGADLKIKTGPNDKTQLAVSKGKASVTDKNKKKTDLGESEEADLDEGGVQAVSKIAVVLKSPADKTDRLTTAATVAQPFTWDVVDPKLKEEFFQISKSERFDAGTTISKPAHQATAVSLAPAHYYWRVGWNTSGKSFYSERRQLVISEDKRLELVDPENETTFDLRPEENSVDFSWNSQVEPKVYMLEVATSPDFKSLRVSEPLDGSKGTSHSVKNLEPRQYFWRVRAFDKDNKEIAASRSRSFILKVKVPKLPELVKPLPEEALALEPVEFGWKKLDKAVNYRVIVTSDPEQKEIVTSKAAAGGTLLWKPERAAPYFWSVKALNSKSVVIGQSEVRRLVLQVKDRGPAFKLITPKDQAEVTRDISQQKPDPIMFEWKVLRKIPAPPTIMISNDAEFKEFVKQDKLLKETLPVRLRKPGTYYWKLESRSENGKIVELSAVTSFTLKALNTLLAPQIIEPANKDSIEINEPTPVKFSWQPIVNAAQYHIVLQRRDPRNNQMVTLMDRLMKETTVTSTPLPEGEYSWSLTSVDAQNTDGLASTPYQFKLVPHEEMDAPKLNAPVIK